MRKILKFIGLVLFISLSNLGYTQNELSLFLSDSLIIKDISGNVIADPFTGGVESPQFFKLELNGDSKEDLVFFDRKNNKLNTYINNGSPGNAIYRHSPEFEHLFPKGRFTYYFLDMDRDGDKDIICGDPIANQMNFYINDGLAAPLFSFTFRSPLQYLHFTPPAPGAKNYFGNAIQHIHAIDDIDNDGDLDFVSLGPLGGSIRLFLNRQVEDGHPKDSLDFHLVDLCYGYYNEGLDNTIEIGQSQCPKYYTRRHVGGSSLLLIDLNKDGDKDLLMGNNSFDNLLMLENGFADFNASYDTMIAWDSIFPRNTTQAKMHVFPSASYTDINDDGIKDLVVVPTWNADYTTKGVNQTMLYINSGFNDSPVFNYVGNNFLMNSSIDLGENCSPAFYDYDKDGDQDLFIAHSGDAETTGLAKDQIALYKNIGTKTKPELQLVDLNYGGFDQFNLEYSRLTIYDLDKDGNAEFYLGQKIGEVHQFKNGGSATSPNFTRTSTNFVGQLALYGYAAPAFWDYDGDGATDILLGSFSGNIAYYKNTGTNTAPVFSWQQDQLGKMFTNEFTYRTNPPGFEGIGSSTPVVTDLNGDNVMEVLAGSLHGGLFAWKPTSNPNDSFHQYENFYKHLDYKGDTLGKYFFGRNVAVAAADLDGDTIQDIIVTTDAGGLFYLSGKARKFKVGIPQLKTQALKIYPNPTDDYVLIDNLPNIDGKELFLFNLEGKQISNSQISGRKKKIDLSNLPKGVYILKVQTAGYQDFVYRINKI